MASGKKQLFIVFNLFLCSIIASAYAASSEKSKPEYPIFREFRPLFEDELAQAHAERNAADKMLQEYMDLYLTPSPEDFAAMAKDPLAFENKPPSVQQIRDFYKVIDAYREVIDKYEGTEIAAYCQLRIDAPYKYIKDYDEARLQNQIAAIKYAGTSYEPRAYSSIGLMYLQHFHEPLMAIAWFNKIPNPNSENPGLIVNELQYNKAHVYYISAQENIARCEIELGRAEDAAKRFERLSLKYPQYSDNFVKELERLSMQDETKKTSVGSQLSDEEYEESLSQIEQSIDKQMNLLKESYSSVLPDASKILEPFSDEEKAVYERCLNFLKMRWNIVAERREEANEAIKKIASIGDKVIEPIMYEYNRDATMSFRYEIISILGQRKSVQARDILLDIALGKIRVDNNAQKRMASQNFISSLEDKSEAKKLLVSQDTDVLNYALVGLKGQPVDRNMLVRFSEILGAEKNDLGKLILCWNIASIFAEDPNTTYAAQKVSLIIDAIEKPTKISDSEVKYSHTYYTYSESTYSSYIDALSKIKGADSFLKESTARTSGLTRYCILIARANRGDASVKNELIKILSDKDAEAFRVWAARCFEIIGTQDDIPFLKVIADSDPLARDFHGSYPAPPAFLVRMAANNAIKKIQAKSEK